MALIFRTISDMVNFKLRFGSQRGRTGFILSTYILTEDEKNICISNKSEAGSLCFISSSRIHMPEAQPSVWCIFPYGSKWWLQGKSRHGDLPFKARELPWGCPCLYMHNGEISITVQEKETVAASTIQTPWRLCCWQNCIQYVPCFKWKNIEASGKRGHANAS